MELFEFNYPEVPQVNDQIVLCLGYYDGIHLGHQALINQAKKEGYKVGVLTFDNSPAYILGKISENYYLTSVADKAEYLSELDIDYLLIMHFDLEVSKLTKDEFINNVIKPLNPVKLYCGEDYRFGVRGEGEPKYLSYYFETVVFDTQKIDGVKISSRDIVKAIQNRNIPKATQLLGRPYRINGLVVDGNHYGRTINYPTANLKLDYPYVYPAIGVYMGYAEVLGKRYKAIINIGTHPTVVPLYKPIIEVHILDFSGNIYGKDIFVEFIDYIRKEMKFDSVDDLIAQLEKDKERAKNSLQ